MTRILQHRYRVHLPRSDRSPRTLPQGAKVLGWALFTLVLLLAASQVAMEGLDLRFAQPFRNEHQYKVRHYQLEVRQPSITYLGSSQVHNGIMPALVEDEAGRHGLTLGPGFNLGLGSTGIGVAAVLARDVLRDEGRPQIVVVGIAPLLLFAEGREPQRNQVGYGSLADVTRLTLEGESPPFRLAQSALLGARNLVHYPARSLAKQPGKDYRAKHLRASQGGRWLPSEAGWARVAPPEAWQVELDRLSILPTVTFQDDSFHARDLLRIWDTCTERGMELVLVDLPQHPDFHARQLPPNAEESYRNWIQDFCARRGIAYADLTEPRLYGNSDYGDPVHLNPIGAAKLSRRLGQWLATQR